MAIRRSLMAVTSAALLVAVLIPGSASACACGCGVFGVGTSSLFPSASGGQVWGEYDFMDQDENRSGDHRAPAADNDDKDIRTNAYTIGGQYMIDRHWGVTVQVPYWQRTFATTDEITGAPATFRHQGFGDIRIMGMYTGFSADMSSGVSFGVKLPTGGFHDRGFDRDTSIGSGSTDLLLAAYHLGALNKANTLSYFAQASWDRPLAYQGGYKPGQEVDGAVGVVYGGLTLGKVKLAPVVQLIAAHRDRDTGPESDSPNSGYDRILASPGVEVSSGDWKVYGDVAFAVYQSYRGDQLAAPAVFKVIVSRRF